MFWALALISVGQEHHQAGEQIPLGFARDHKLINDRLRNIREIAELCLPEHERFGKIAAITIFESQHTGFRQSRVVDSAMRLPFGYMFEGNVLLLSLNVEKNGVSLVERAPAAILPAKPH